MQDYEDLRSRKQNEYEEQRHRRIELRNSKFIDYNLWMNDLLKFVQFSDVDTDETEGRGGELEEETVEFFIKEETILLDE